LLDSKEQKEKEQIVNFTEVASNKLQSIMKEQNSEDSYLRVSITENPNGGFEYVFGLVEAPEKNDIVVDSIIKTVVDPESVKFVEGSNIDYVEGFQRSGFVISNPNFQQGGGGCGGGSCGCGGGQAENSSEQQAQEGGCCGGASAGQGCCQG
jgi:iron-sulfur cluster assembly protein